MKELFLKTFAIAVLYSLGIYIAYMASQPAAQPKTAENLGRRIYTLDKKRPYVSNSVSIQKIDKGSDPGIDSLKKVYGIASDKKAAPTLQIQLKILSNQDIILANQRMFKKYLQYAIKSDTLVIHDTVDAHPIFVIQPTIHKGLVPIPSTNFLPLRVLFGRNIPVGKMFRDSSYTTYDTAYNGVSYTPRS